MGSILLFLLVIPAWLLMVGLVRYLVIAMGILAGDPEVLKETCTEEIEGVERDVPTMKEFIQILKG